MLGLCTQMALDEAITKTGDDVKSPSEQVQGLSELP